MTIKNALISVSDKTGIVEFATALNQLGINLISTGGTAKLLQEHKIAVTEVSDYTGFPEMMAGRLKTLHPKIHGGILARRGEDEQIMQDNAILPIDLVVVNLYPFAQTVATLDVSLNIAVENIDIGGPTMVRAAAKNHQSVAVVVDPFEYPKIIEELKTKQQISADTRFKLAVKAFSHTAKYDGQISNYLSSLNSNFERGKFSGMLNLQYRKEQSLRYGENPHQEAAFYNEGTIDVCVANAAQIQGKELSYNNIADADAALECVKEFDQPACVIVKHANPCGVALRANITEAYQAAFKTDPSSAFGGIIAFNRELDQATCQAILDQQFVEVIIAPKVNDKAKVILASKDNVRVLETGFWQQASKGLEFKKVTGGLLVQDKDLKNTRKQDLEFVTKIKPSEQQIADLLFIWQVAKHVKSNAIVYGKDLMTVGIGAGQMSRVYSARIGAIKAEDAELSVIGSVMASDAFFPFRDGVDIAAEAGVKAIIQPGGSIKDKEVIEAANQHKIAMVFTRTRHFKH